MNNSTLMPHERTEFVPYSTANGMPLAESGTICADCGWLLHGSVWWAAHPDAERQHAEHAAAIDAKAPTS